jgi:hypothetical protein
MKNKLKMRFIKFKDDNDALYFTQNYKKGKNVTIGK